MSKQQQKIGAEVKAAFMMWMKGEPFAALKRKLHRPLSASFTALADAHTYKQAKAARDRAVKAQKRSAA